MKLLPDTHLLLWMVGATEDARRRLPAEAAGLIEDPDNEVYFSAVSVWEAAIKQGADKADFRVEAGVFRRALLDGGYIELTITSEHAAAVGRLPRLHKDSFDRLLVAQAMVEGITLLTVDEVLARYPGPVRRI
ncbi:MAG: type II toxin-antitoxin system VapC family toxin [Acidobacteriota bacterium]|nr:type II toxin-antitoxin system VapC family toxin [Acidobacteriota bacterium]